MLLRKVLRNVEPAQAERTLREAENIALDLLEGARDQ